MIIVITGGSGTTAKEIINHFNNKAKAVVTTLRNSDSKWKMKNGVYYTKCELTKSDQIEGCIDLIRDRLGKPHVWINTVGGFSQGKSVEKYINEWEKMYQLNFQTALNCIKLILPIMKQNDFGRIINFGSRAGKQGMALAGPYSTSKASLHNLTKTISLEIKGDITCNAVLPKIIDTPINREKMPNTNFNTWSCPKDIANKIESIIKSTENGKLIYV